MTEKAVFWGFNYSLNNGFTNSWGLAGKSGPDALPNMTNPRRVWRHFLCILYRLRLRCSVCQLLPNSWGLFSLYTVYRKAGPPRFRKRTIPRSCRPMFGKTGPGRRGSAAASKNNVRVSALWPLKKRLAAVPASAGSLRVSPCPGRNCTGCCDSCRLLRPQGPACP